MSKANMHKYIGCIDASVASYNSGKSTAEELCGALTATLYIALLDEDVPQDDYNNLQRTADLCSKNKLTVAQLVKAIEEGKDLNW